MRQLDNRDNLAKSAVAAAMAQLLQYVLFLILPIISSALKFDLHAVHAHEAAKHERCIRNFVAKDQLVVVTAILDGYRGDGQAVNMHVRCSCLFGNWKGGCGKAGGDGKDNPTSWEGSSEEDVKNSDMKCQIRKKHTKKR